MEEERKSNKNRFRRMFKWLFKPSRGLFSVALPLFFIGGIWSHELAVRYVPEYTCTACHEMTEPVKRWSESGVAKNHPNCADCHFDAGMGRVWDMNKRAVELFFVHFRWDPKEPIKPPPEPLFLEEGREPGYFSLVPNHRCFQCKDAKNHQENVMAQIHSKLIRDISAQPCRDCHNHEMRNGQKFYEKVLPPEEQQKLADQPAAQTALH